MSNNKSFFATRTWKQIVNVAYNVGASVVIIGAMFKIIHIPGGDIVIGVGLIAEAILFLLTALDPLPHDYHWENVYPEILEARIDDPFSKKTIAHIPQRKIEVEDSKLSEKLDKILKEANLDAKLMQGLSQSIKDLSSTTANLSNVGVVGKDAVAYAAQLADASKKVEALNKLYTMQIESTNAQLSASKSVVAGMASTVEGTKKLQAEVVSLASNIESLNAIYGGMLSAMGKK